MESLDRSRAAVIKLNLLHLIKDLIIDYYPLSISVWSEDRYSMAPYLKNNKKKNIKSLCCISRLIDLMFIFINLKLCLSYASINETLCCSVRNIQKIKRFYSSKAMCISTYWEYMVIVLNCNTAGVENSI